MSDLKENLHTEHMVLNMGPSHPATHGTVKFLLTLDGRKIYHACDTGLFYDMKLIGEEGLDVAILPIGDNFTMGPDDALLAVKLLVPKVVIPIHYDTFDVIKQDPQSFAARVEGETSAQCLVLKPGDSYRL